MIFFCLPRFVLIIVGRAAESAPSERDSAGAARGAVARARHAAQRLEHEARRARQVQPAVRLAAAQQWTHRGEQGNILSNEDLPRHRL